MTPPTTLREPIQAPSDFPLGTAASEFLFEPAAEGPTVAAANAWKEFLEPIEGQVFRDLIDEVSTDLAPLIKHLDKEDRAEFFHELAEALAEPGDDRLGSMLREWFRTSESLADPVRREILLGANGDGDYVEAERPA